MTATGVRLRGPEATADPEADRSETGWLDELAARAQSTHGVATAAVELARELAPRVPPPSGGRTIERWEVLASLGAGDLSVARIAEAHLDALAILAESGPGSVTDRGVWGVYAAEGPGMRLDATPGLDGWQLTGRKPWCSGADVNDRALVTAHVDGGRRLFAIDLRSSTVSGGDDFGSRGGWLTCGAPRSSWTTHRGRRWAKPVGTSPVPALPGAAWASRPAGSAAWSAWLDGSGQPGSSASRTRSAPCTWAGSTGT